MTLKIVNSTSHWVVPRIVIAILAALWIAMMIQRYLRCKTEGRPFIALKGYHFFMPGWDKWKLLGGVGVFVAYIYLMELISFLPASILCIFGLNVIYTGDRTKRSLTMSAVLAVVASVLIYVIFGILFRVTLP